MKRVAIIGATGMLGSMVYRTLKDVYHLVLIYRDEKKITLLRNAYGDIKEHKAVQLDFQQFYKDFVLKEQYKANDVFSRLTVSIGSVDAVINCAGVIRPGTGIDQSGTFFINSALPHLLSRMYKDRLIHVSTDCVFDGKKGAPYKETDPPNPNDIYGLSKSLGEPSQNSLVLRTSLIGPELDGETSLLGWLSGQKGIVYGFTNHLWNGVTTKQFAIICRTIIDNRNVYPKNGLFHIYSDPHTKYEILKMLQKKYNIPVTIRHAESLSAIDRRLASIFSFSKSLDVPSLHEMIQAL